MPKLARLYLDTARLGLMSPSAQLAARDFARLAGEGVSTLYFQKLLRGRVSLVRGLPHLPGLAEWTGIEGIKQRLRRLLRLPASAPVLFASRATALMRWAARRLWRRCRRVLVPDTAWPPYARILEEERCCRGEIVSVPIRSLVQSGQIDARGLIACLSQAYVCHGCDGLFVAAVSHDGVRIPTAPLLAALPRQTNVRFAVLDGAQELTHVPVDLATTACDIWLAGAHKWLGGHQPLGIACLANPDSAVDLHKSLVTDCQTKHDDDPLLRFLLRLDGHRIQDVQETINLAPLFSTWGALRDILTDADAQTRRFWQRQENSVLVGRLVTRHGWKSLAVCPALATGITVVQASDPAIRQLSAEVLETALEMAGVTATALDGGRLRLSLPAHPLDDDQQAQLIGALAIGPHDCSSLAAERAIQHSCM